MALAKLIKKEVVATLKNPQIIFSIIFIPLMFIAMGGITSMGVKAAQKMALTTKIALIDMDRTELTKELVSRISDMYRGRLDILHSFSKDIVRRYGLVVVLPKGFSEYILSGKTKVVFLTSYVSLETISIASTVKLSLLDRVADSIADTVKKIIIERKGISPELLKLEIVPNATVSIGRLWLRAQDAQSIASMVMNTVFIAAMITALVFQFGALSMAQEKEEKTFEVLLTQPIPRSYIGISKMVGVLVLVFIEVAVFAFSWMYYMRSVAPRMLSENVIQVLTSVVGFHGIALVFVDLLLVMIAMATLGLILGSFARDTKSAGMMVGPMWFIVMMGALSTQFLGLPSGSANTIAVASTMVIAPMLLFNALIFGYTNTAMSILAVNAIEAIALIYLLSKVLESEKMIVGFGLRKLRRE